MTPYGTIVKKDGLTAFLSPEGRTLIPPSRYTVGSIDIEDACLVLKSGYSGKCGLFDLSDGKQVIDFRYDDITLLGFNRALGKDGSRRYLLDTSTGDVIASLPPNIGAAHLMRHLSPGFSELKATTALLMKKEISCTKMQKIRLRVLQNSGTVSAADRKTTKSGASLRATAPGLYIPPTIT